MEVPVHHPHVLHSSTVTNILLMLSAVWRSMESVVRVFLPAYGAKISQGRGAYLKFHARAPVEAPVLPGFLSSSPITRCMEYSGEKPEGEKENQAACRNHQ